MYIKTIDEICIDADNNKDNLEYIHKLANELNITKKNYPLNQVQFMYEHLAKLWKECYEKDKLIKKH